MHISKRCGGRPRILALSGALLLAACGSSGDDGNGGGGGGGGDVTPLSIFTTNLGAAGDTRVVHSGGWMAFLADELTSGPGGSDQNGDGDTNDKVPVAVDLAHKLEYVVPVAARDLALLGGQLYLVVDEVQDAQDWNGDALIDARVLLHWNVGMPLSFVDTLDPTSSPALVVVGETLFYASASMPAGAMETSLRAISAEFPLEKREVFSDDVKGPLRPVLLAEDEGLLLLGLDEQREGRDLNGDMDMLDLRVLALLDGTGLVSGMGYQFVVQNLGLAGRPIVTAPFRARANGPNDWLLGVLVNEASQGTVSLNDATEPSNGLPPGWLPPTCTTQDVDLLDDVLFFLRFGEWSIDPLANAPVNTGFAGDDRILIAGDYIGTIVREASQTGCSLNGDMDLADRVFRWVRAERPLPVPPTAVELLLAVDNLPGGTRGVAELQGRFVVAVDEQAEGRDLDGDGVLLPGALIGWLDPAGGGGWTFDHEPGEGFAYAVGTWMAEMPGRQRLGVAFSEESSGTDINGDGDVLDSVPTFPVFATNPVELLFPGFGVACPPTNPGIVIQNGWAFYRVSEELDGFDSNGDGDLDDLLLWRSRLSDGRTFIEAILNDVPDRPALDPSDDLTPAFGAFLADESLAGDLNADGRMDALVLRYFVW